jgi:histidinol-phosphatase
VEDDLELALEAALAGADVAMGFFAVVADLRHEHKLDGSVVTEADRAVEATIRAVLCAAHPADAVLGEEGGERAGTGGRRWIIDPIDGTALFVAGDDRWLVLLALEEAGEMTIGVAVVPVQRRLWWARRGGGAWEAAYGGAPRRITVAPDGGDLAAARLGVLPVFDDPATGMNVVPKAPGVAAPLLAITPALPWGLHPPLQVARGDLDVAVQTSGMVWDFAATSLIVAEAGGVYRGLDGSRRPRPGPSVFARSGALAEAAIAAAGASAVADGGAAVLGADAVGQGVDQAEQRTQRQHEADDAEDAAQDRG